MKAYIPNLISELKEFYKDYLYDLASYSNIPTHLDALAQRMHIGIKENQPSILSEISNYHKDYLDKIELIDPQHFFLMTVDRPYPGMYFQDILIFEK